MIFSTTGKEWICSYGFSINYYLLFYTSSMFYLPPPDYFIGNNHIYTRLMPLRQQWKKPINAITKPCNSNIFTTLLSVMVFIFDVKKCKGNSEEIDNKIINSIPWLFKFFSVRLPIKAAQTFLMRFLRHKSYRFTSFTFKSAPMFTSTVGISQGPRWAKIVPILSIMDLFSNQFCAL